MTSHPGRFCASFVAAPRRTSRTQSSPRLANRQNPLRLQHQTKRGRALTEGRSAPINIRIDVEYDGENFCGWQRQIEGQPTIQACIEDTIASVVGKRVVVYGAGRTDAGVHARCQVANFYADSSIPAEKWGLMLNTKLPPQIRILRSTEVSPEFHAQKRAVGKIYEYRILNRKYSSALDRRVYFCPHPLDWQKIREALPRFIGEKDFLAFQAKNGTVRTTVRRIYRFEVTEEEDGLYRFLIEGNGFLKHMVRNIMGTVLDVGEGRKAPHEIDEVFASQNREFAGRTVPARGLFLNRVIYDE